MGIDFNFAKAIGAFVNGTTTFSHTVQNIRKKETAIDSLMPLIVLSGFFAVFGAYSSQYISQTVQYLLFIAFILLAVILLFSMHLKSRKKSYTPHLFVYLSLSVIAFVSGLLGLGGGAVYLPLLIYAGMSTKESIYATSAMIPLVSLSSFIVYMTFIPMDWVLLFIVAIGAVLGGFIGAKLTHRIKNEKFLKIFISVILLFIAAQMSYKVWGML